MRHTRFLSCGLGFIIAASLAACRNSRSSGGSNANATRSSQHDGSFGGDTA
jgi:hypothetical protein